MQSLKRSCTSGAATSRLSGGTKWLANAAPLRCRQTIWRRLSEGMFKIWGDDAAPVAQKVPGTKKTAERCASDVASCCVVFGCVVAWCVVLSSVVMCCAAASCPVLCCAVLCCVVLSCCAVLCCVVLSRLPCPVLSCLVLPCPVLPPSNPVLSLSVLSVCPSVCLSVCPSVRLWTRASGGGMGRNAPDLPEQDAVRLLADPRSVLERIRQSKLIWALSAEVGQATGARGGRCRSVQADNLQLPELTMEQTAEQTIAQQADPLHTHTHTVTMATRN